jgi:hypothetical protein
MEESRKVVYLMNVAEDGYGRWARRIVLITATYGQCLLDQKNNSNDNKDGEG